MMKYINKRRLAKRSQGQKNSGVTLGKRFSRLVAICCAAVVSVQAIVMAAALIHQYIRQEKENTSYILETTHSTIDSSFQYIKELTLSLQEHSGLQAFFQEGASAQTDAKEALKTAASLFSERNQPDTPEPLIEKIYLFNFSGHSVYNLYYPATLTQIEADQKQYTELYEAFSKKNVPFYFDVNDDTINLCLWLYDSRLEPLGSCIFALNKDGLAYHYQAIENYGYYYWKICSEEQLIAGKENLPFHGELTFLEHSLPIGFGLTLHAGIPGFVIYRSLGTIVAVIALISAALILLLSLLGHSLGRRYAKPLEKEMYETQLIAQQAQIQYLQSQINPHFLSNALSMIQMRAALNGDREVQELIYQLSGLYQGKIFRKDEYFIHLYEEIEIIDFYLSLQHNRFREKITYSISYEGNPEDYEHLLVPRLSVEPIVENAFCHGLQPKPEKGVIQVSISKDDNKLKIMVKDDGIGFDPDSIAENTEDQTHSHVGLWNTNKMIRNLCGKEYGLTIESKIGKGTTVSIVLPIKPEETYVESNDC